MFLSIRLDRNGQFLSSHLSKLMLENIRKCPHLSNLMLGNIRNCPFQSKCMLGNIRNCPPISRLNVS
jgi:hypothetical protein